MAVAICAVVCQLYAVAEAQHGDNPADHASEPATRSTDSHPPAAGITAPTDPHVRIEDAHMRRVIDYAVDFSPTLRELLGRLEHSDVVAYIRCDMSIASSTSGNLSFVGHAGGLRYVLIRLRHLGSKPAQAALIGHELRHAVEIADAPSVIDVATFDAEYARIGFITARQMEHTVRSYETMNAVHAGDQIRHELRQNTE
jgi:hypothetical protein